MNILVASSCRSRGIARWMPVLLAASFCLTVAIPAQAVVIDWDYDGSYYPTDDPPPTGQDTWTVFKNGTLDIVPNSPVAGVADFTDDLRDARMAMFNLFTGTDFAAAPGGVEWEYTCKTSFTGQDWAEGGLRTRTAFFGVRDEGGSGKKIMFAHSKFGKSLFYDDDYTIWNDDDNPLTAAPGEYDYHTYEIRKYLDTFDVMQVAFYLDGNLEDTRPYADFPDDLDAGTDGVGIWGNTLGTADYSVDDVQFYCDSPAIEPIPGDANLDNVVNDQDASILAAHWQMTEMGWGDGDFNDDQVVNDQDASILAAHWQESREGAAPVPEPSTLIGLLALGLAGLVALRRR